MTMDYSPEFNYSLGLRLTKGQVFFGPGLVMLLQALEQTGSLNRAANSVDMSYSKGWNAIKRAEEALGFSLVEKRTGGVGGGGSFLTKEGRDFLETYREFERRAYRATEEIFGELYGEMAEQLMEPVHS